MSPSVVTPSCAERSWTRTSRYPRAHGSGWIPRRTGPAGSPSPRRGSPWSARATRCRSEPSGGTAVTRHVRIGVQLQPQHADYAEIRRAVAAAEEVGVDVVFNWDHFFPLYGEA